VVGSLIGAFFARPSHPAVDVAKVLNSLPKEDRENLEWFFRGFWESSYVLFGNKPMALGDIRDPHHIQVNNVHDFMESISHCLQSPQAEAKGLEVWRKYKHLFPSSNFIFLENHGADWTGDRSVFYLINKPVFLRTLRENIDYFQEVLGAKVTPEQILEDCLNSNDLLKDVLKDHKGLLGILLGFGRRNADLFWRRYQATMPSPGFSTLEEEHVEIDIKLTSLFSEPYAHDFNLFDLFFHGFRADQEDPETKRLEKEYRETYKKILSQYENGNILEIMLRQFCR
jgi:hypothetical protein